MKSVFLGLEYLLWKCLSSVVKFGKKPALEHLDSNPNLTMPSLHPAQIEGAICKQGLWCLTQNKFLAQSIIEDSHSKII